MSAIDTIKRIFRGTMPSDSTDQAWLRSAADMGTERVARYDTYEKAYDGDHDVKLLARAKEFLEGDGIQFSENFCATVVDSKAHRLKVESFQVVDNDDATDWLAKALAIARFNVKQGIVHVETPKLGDGFLIVGFNDDLGWPTLSWNRPHMIKPVYADDDTEQLLYLVKRWTTAARSPSNPGGDTIHRMNIYFPDRIEKWFSADKDGEVWAEHMGDTDDDGNLVWPTPWIDKNDDPFGVNGFHFRNNPQGRPMGRSELRKAIPFNRLLNKQSIDLFDVMDRLGWPTIWGTGLGDTTNIKIAIGELLKGPDGSKFGQFEPADPTKAVATMVATLTRMSAATATPLHDLIKGDIPSGESQKTAESDRTEWCEDFAEFNEQTWADTAKMMWRLADTYGDDQVPEFDPDAEIKVTYKSPETRNETTEATVALADYELGASRATLLRKRGYDPDAEQKARAEEDRALAPPPPDVDHDDDADA